MSKKKIRVLFVGNSYTYYNDMPDLFREKAEKLEYDATVASVTKGGYYLKAFADPQDEYGQILRQTVEGQEYDVVAIGEATQLTEYQFSIFGACVRGVNECPKRIYLTWSWRCRG